MPNAFPAIIRKIQRLIDGPGVLGSGDNGKVLTWNNATGEFVMTSLPAAVTPGGSDGQVQLNVAGAFGGDAGLLFNPTTDVLTIGGQLVVPIWRPASDGTAALKVTKADGLTIVGVWDTTNRRLVFQHASVANTKAYIDDTGIYFSRSTDGTYLSFLQSSQGDTPSLTLQASGNILIKPGGGAVTYSFLPTGVFSATRLDAAGGTFSVPSNVSMLIDTDPAANIDQGIKVLRGTRAVSAHHYIMAWFRGTTEFARITWDGRFGLGTNAPTAYMDLPASTAAYASARIRSGLRPTANGGNPFEGDVWNDGTHLYWRMGGVDHQLDN